MGHTETSEPYKRPMCEGKKPVKKILMGGGRGGMEIPLMKFDGDLNSVGSDDRQLLGSPLIENTTNWKCPARDRRMWEQGIYVAPGVCRLCAIL